MARAIGTKYQATVIDGRVAIVKTRTGEPIPEDEPLILFRGRDRMALATLDWYRRMCSTDGCTEEHMRSIDNRISAFTDFAEKHPERMKQPGCNARTVSAG